MTEILRQICASLAEAHARGLVHRDIRPANVMFCRVGLEADFVKVLDFGLVKSRVPTSPDSPALTGQLTFAGTPAYAAPEVAQFGADQATPASDLYSPGCIAYWLLSGRQVFESDTPMEMLSKHISGKVEPLSAVVEGTIPVPLELAVHGGYATLPSD